MRKTVLALNNCKVSVYSMVLKYFFSLILPHFFDLSQTFAELLSSYDTTEKKKILDYMRS